jgi:hypothetical protein
MSLVHVVSYLVKFEDGDDHPVSDTVMGNDAWTCHQTLICKSVKAKECWEEKGGFFLFRRWSCDIFHLKPNALLLYSKM